MTPKSRSSRRFLLASTLLLASATVAAAQTAQTPPAPTPPAPPAADWRHHGDHHPGPQNWEAQRAKMEERRLAELHTKLDLKPGQEPAWQAFVTGLQAARPAKKPHEKPDWEKMETQTTPERLDHMLARIDEMRSHLAQMDQAVKTFYAALTKDQQTIFDDNFKMMGRGRGGPGDWKAHGMGREHGPMEHGQGGQGWMGRPPMGPPAGPPPPT